jgi:DNA-binding winged helix-turn-helix (wHTH) protein/tetratricopeptide (TPR) repeat protein/predicted Ser/Thr protein kinase
VVGKRLGHYRVLELLGRGGMGVVYRALDTRLDRVVALKVLLPDTASDADRTRRFVREAKAASALNHPNIVTVYEIDSADGTDFIALEYVDGTPLHQVIAGRPLEPARALDFANQIADALAAAHAAGIVHRDLKPANIMVTKSSGRDAIKVLDFGLAKRIDALSSDGKTFSALTRHGAVMGTPAYMAPEQAQGLAVDARADIFSFGAVLYEMLGGRMAFSRDSEINTLMAVLSSTPPPVTAPADLIRVMTRCLEKNPQARYGSGTELRAALAECRVRAESGTQVYEFGPYRLDVALSRLEREGHAITMPPKAFDLLVLLARNPHRVMAKAELMETLWPNTFVEEGNLTQHVYTLRKALGDRPNGKPYIETVPRRGYRLAAEVLDVSAGVAVRDTVVHPTPAAAAATPSRAAVVREGERKRATVLHCGLANASDVAERLGSVEMHDLIEHLHVLADEEVTRYEGVITQKHPDGFVAVFGAREVHEDDARRAILTAIGIDRRVRDLPAPSAMDEERIALKTGITTGPLVISRVTEQERIAYVAVGDALRHADLLQQFAEPGAILINDTTERAVSRHVQTEPVGQVGRSAAFRVAGLRPQATALSQAGRVLGTFIGRDREVSLLDGLLTQVFAGKGHAVSVVGEPGMGKSRLVHEATAAMASRPEPAVILEGRCVSYGSLIPYLPLIDLLRAHCHIAETDPPDVIRAAIDQAVRANGLAADAGTWLLRLIGIVDEATAHDSLSPEAVKARTFDALRLLLLKASAKRPLVIVAEDAHWIDRTSEEFLATLVGQLVATRILLIATYRPGYRAPWMERSYVTQITIGPLSAGESAQLLGSVAGDQHFAAEVSSAILQRGEGNPLFLEELARTVSEQGSGEQVIPETVQGVIMARLDRLPDAAKQLLQTASVVGREAPHRLLARLLQGHDLEAPLADLCRQEFMYERAGGDEPFFVFKHALTQDVAYDSLLSRRRRELHLEAARALEELYSDRLDELTATLAYHYARTDLIDESVTWLLRAAERAARVYANAEAILHLDLAMRRLQRLPEGQDRDRRMLDVALRHAHSLYFLGRFRESIDVLLPHEARLSRLDDAALSGAYSFWLAHMYSRLGDQRRATANAERAIQAATEAGDLATLGKAHGLLALEGHWSGQTAHGVSHGATAVTLLQTQSTQRWWLGMTHFYLAMNHLLTGQFDAALAEAAFADQVGKEIADPRLQTYAGFIVGWVEASRGRTGEAIEACRRALELAPDRVSRAYSSMILGYALVEHGEHRDALERLQPTIAEIEGFGFPQWQALARVFAADALRREGRFAEAESMVERGLRVATGAEYWYAVGFAHRTAGLILRDQGRVDEANARFADAVSTFERIGAAFEAERSR